MAELQADGVDSLDALIAKHPGCKLWLDMDLLETDPSISQEEKDALRACLESGVAEGWVEVYDADDIPAEKENTNSSL